jgi:hypothetical protein
MALLTITINDPVPGFESPVSELAYVRRALAEAEKELIQGHGKGITTGTIFSCDAAGRPHAELGSWSYNSSATSSIRR